MAVLSGVEEKAEKGRKKRAPAVNFCSFQV